MNLRKLGWAIDLFITTGYIVGCWLALAFSGAVTAQVWGRAQIEGVIAVGSLLLLHVAAILHLYFLVRARRS